MLSAKNLKYGLLTFNGKASLDVCDRCLNTLFTIVHGNAGDYIVRCLPPLPVHGMHGNPPALGVMLRACRRTADNNVRITPPEVLAAQILSHYNKQLPCPRSQLDSILWGDTTLSERQRERKTKAVIEALRRKWLLPVGSSKSNPSGYWIITLLSDYKDWVKRASSSSITLLSTIHANARANFPEFADQLELPYVSQAQ